MGQLKNAHSRISLPGLLLKVLVLGFMNAMAVWSAFVLISEGVYWLVVVLAAGCGLIDYIFLSERAYPWRYLVPGLAFMAAMVVYPIGYTAVVAFTNYGTGHLLNKAQVIEHYCERLSLQEDMPEYECAIYRSEDGQFAVVLAPIPVEAATPAPVPVSDDGIGEVLIGLGHDALPLSQSELPWEDEDGDQIPERIGPCERLGVFELFEYMNYLQKLEFRQGPYVLKMRSVDRFATYSPQYRYDAELDALIDADTGLAYAAHNGSFVADSGQSLDVGYRAPVGWSNFSKLVRSPQVSGPFVRVFVWTFEWAFLSVLTTFVLGLLLAVLLNDEKLRFKGLYRVLLIVPYAVPAVISALVWRGLLNTEVGLINNVIEAIIGVRVPWLQEPFWAKTALVLVNLWLGFPYMMLINLGSLQSIPSELYEAARVDGATGWQQFGHITLPLLLVSVAPLLVSSFAFNFNNFSVVYLVTKGRPAIAGAQTPAGATDILISYTYRLAFESAGGTDYGLASAVTILIFLIIATLSWANFRFTGALEEVRENV